MKQVMKSLVVVGAMLAAGAATAEMMGDVKPVVGVDYYQVWMKGQSTVKINGVTFNGTDNLFPKSYPGATVYVGAKFMENFGAELGYDWSAKKKKSYTTGTGAAAETENSTVKRSGFHLDLVGYLPVMDCTNVFASIGAGWVKAKITGNTVDARGVVDPDTVSSKTKTVLRAGIGASYMFTEMFGARVKVGYEGTKSLRNNFNNLGDAKYFKDSTTLAAGLFAQF